MITDELVNAFINAFELNGGHFLGNNEFDTVRKALEAYEQSKWVKFDVNDESSYPPARSVIVKKKNGSIGVAFFANNRWSPRKDIVVTNWQYLPQFKE